MSVNDVIVSSNASDAEAVENIKNHHAELAERVTTLTESLLSAAEHGRDIEAPRAAALEFLTGELLPHAAAEEGHLYPAAGRTERVRPLIESMIAAHRIIGMLVERIRNESSPVRVAAAADALRVLFGAHLTDENERILPVVAADPEVSLAEVTHGMHELLGQHQAETEHGPGRSCSCGEDDTDDPVLDVRDVPHSIRHATVFGAFDAIPNGGTLVLVAHHDPIPLLQQLSDRGSGQVAVSYEQRGPATWRLRLTKP